MRTTKGNRKEVITAIRKIMLNYSEVIIEEDIIKICKILHKYF